MDVFSAIADPTRRGMLEMLSAREHSAGDFVAGFPAITQSAVSQHLKVLREASLVKVRTDGARRVYSLNPSRLAEVDRWIARYRNFWPGKLDALAKHLDRNTNK
jgi:DNA-binding transcriptional ArsR family regulator